MENESKNIALVLLNVQRAVANAKLKAVLTHMAYIQEWTPSESTSDYDAQQSQLSAEINILDTAIESINESIKPNK